MVYNCARRAEYERAVRFILSLQPAYAGAPRLSYCPTRLASLLPCNIHCVPAELFTKYPLYLITDIVREGSSICPHGLSPRTPYSMATISLFCASTFQARALT